MTESEADNEHQMDIVLRGMITQIKKTYRKEFSKVFDDLLANISIDFDIPLQELTERYTPTYKFHIKKPRDPTTACLDTTKAGDPCTKTRKDGFDYCGIHLRTRGIDPNNPNVGDYSTNSTNNGIGEDEQEERYIPKSPKRTKPKPKPKSEPKSKPTKPTIQAKTEIKQSEVEPEPELEPTEEDETTNSSHDDDDDDDGTGHSFDIWEHDDKKYVVLDDRKVFAHPGVDEINSIAELGDVVAFKLNDGTVEWV
jgi:hypothetical protein